MDNLPKFKRSPNLTMSMHTEYRDMFTMVTSNMFLPELRQKQGWRHEKMKLESAQIS